MKILVTGGAGFIASHIVEGYIEEGHDVVIVDNLSTGKQKNVNEKATLYNVDIRDLQKLQEVFEKEKPDVVNHHAAQASAEFSVGKPIEDYEINILGLINLLECCKKHDVKKILFASSAAVYGEAQPGKDGLKEEEVLFQISPYGAGKRAGELYVKSYEHLYKIPYVLFRYANVYGPRQAGGEAGVVSTFIQALQEGKECVIFGDGNQTRDYVYVKDLVKANILALDKGENVIINIGSGTATSVNQLGEQLKTVTGGGNFSHGPERPGDIRHSTLCVDKAHQILGWRAETNFADGLRQTVEWFKTPHL